MTAAADRRWWEIPNFAFALKNHLRQQPIEQKFIGTASFGSQHLRLNKHVPQQIALIFFGKVVELQRLGILLPEHLVILNPEVQSLMEICGACERIKNTSIPFSYSSFIKKFISVYCLTLPLGYVLNLHYLVVFMFYVLASLEVIAEEIENPFGLDINDLPLDTICKTIHKTVTQSFDYRLMPDSADPADAPKTGFTYDQ